MKLFLLIFAAIIQYICANSLGSYNIDKTQITVSGLSAGGFMAVQMHVAYSDVFMGVGVLAGGPYYCAKGALSTATNSCMYAVMPLNVDTLVSKTNEFAAAGTIAPLLNIENDRVYIFSGTKDTTVKPVVASEKTEDYYRKINVKEENIKVQNTIAAVHGFPTMIYGSPCGNSNYQTYINDCDYDAAYIMLQFLYHGTLKRPEMLDTDSVEVLSFDQREFISAGNGMLDVGYLYVPERCQDGKTACRLHVSLHGCSQSSELVLVGEKYVRETGYIETADKNDIIILYPQAESSLMGNPNGCFDWWGYTDQDYATRNGVQMKAIYEMIQRLLG